MIKEKKINSINIKYNKEDTKLTLVEEIEELGFIPSIDKKNNIMQHNIYIFNIYKYINYNHSIYSSFISLQTN